MMMLAHLPAASPPTILRHPEPMPHQQQAPQAVIIGGQAVPYSVRRSQRAQRPSLRVMPDHTLLVTLPQHTPVQIVGELLQAHERWILRTLARTAPLPPTDVRHGSLLPYLGDSYQLLHEPRDQVRLSVIGDHTQGTITVQGQLTLPAVLSGLERWYRHEARRELTARVEMLAPQLGVRYSRLTIRDQSTRWASCSSTGTLSFSWRLLLAPAATVDYIVMHELAHLQEHNHSSRFWALVAEHCPNYQQHRQWLRTHQAALQQFLA